MGSDVSVQDNNKKNDLENPLHLGHRQRAKEKLVRYGHDSFSEYELLEMLLFYAIPQKDVKPLAKELMSHYGSLSGLWTASYNKLLKHKGVKENTAALFKLMEALIHRTIRADIIDRPVLDCFETIENYCRVTLGSLDHEVFRLLLLDTKYNLLDDVLHQKGTIDQAAVYPRDIIKLCLERGASGIILVHNHPSGDPTPSKADIYVTRRLIDAAHIMNLTIHDHLVVGKHKVISFKKMNLI